MVLEFWAFLCLCGLGPTVKGTNRADKTSEDAKIALAYERSNLYLWRLIIRAISKDSAAGRALMLLIQDEYGQDLDGFDLLRYLARYANDQSAEDVKRRKAKIDDLSFSASESPMTWMLIVEDAAAQERLGEPARLLPEARRGGGVEELIETLLDKVSRVDGGHVV